MNADQGSGQAPATLNIPATSSTREVQINAILFDADLTKSLELGFDWSVWFGPNAGGAGGGAAVVVVPVVVGKERVRRLLSFSSTQENYLNL